MCVCVCGWVGVGGWVDVCVCEGRGGGCASVCKRMGFWVCLRGWVSVRLCVCVRVSVYLSVPHARYIRGEN